MRNILGLFGIFLVAAIIIQCTSDSTGSSKPGLAGTWEWAKSVGGNVVYIDPETCQCTQSIVFSEAGDYGIYADGVLQEEGSFEIIAESPLNGFTAITFLLSENEAHALLSSTELILIPSELCLACPDSVYYNRQSGEI